MKLLLTVATLLALSEQCQEIRMIAKDESVVVGRSMEFATEDSFVLTFPAGSQHNMPELPNCAESFEFESKYHTFTTRMRLENGNWSKFDSDGMNSEGLSASALHFPRFSYFPENETVRGENCSNAVSQIRLVEYVLASFANVHEIREAIDNNTFPMVYSEKDFNITHPVHYQFVDQSGEGMVLEYTKEGGRRMHNNTIGVFTNSPTFDWHMENLRNYPQLQNKNRDGFSYEFKDEKFNLPAGSGSGLAGIPGDYMSSSRFVKAAALLRFAQKPQHKNDAVMQTFHLMNAADIPNGVIRDHKKSDHEDHVLSDSMYVVVKSLSDGCMYYRAYRDISVRRICFSNMPMDEMRYKHMERRWQNSYDDINTDNMEAFEFNDSN